MADLFSRIQEAEQRYATLTQGTTPSLPMRALIANNTPKDAGDALSEVVGNWEWMPFVGGMVEASDMYDLYMANEASKAGHETAEQRKLLNDFFVDTQRPGTFWYDINKIIGQGFAFTGEFMATGGVAPFAKAAAKHAGTKAVKEGVYNSIKSGLTKAAAAAMDAGTRVAAVDTASEALGHMVGDGARVSADTYRRMLGDVSGMSYEEAEGFKILFEASDMSFRKAVPAAVYNRWIEYFSESTGGLLGHTAAKIGIAKWWMRKNGGDAGLFAKTLQRTGWHGIIPEYFEERVGGFLRGATGQIVGLEEAELRPGETRWDRIVDTTIPDIETSLKELIAFGVHGTAIQTGISGYSKVAEHYSPRLVDDVSDEETVGYLRWVSESGVEDPPPPGRYAAFVRTKGRDPESVDELMDWGTKGARPVVPPPLDEEGKPIEVEDATEDAAEEAPTEVPAEEAPAAEEAAPAEPAAQPGASTAPATPRDFDDKLVQSLVLEFAQERAATVQNGGVLKPVLEGLKPHQVRAIEAEARAGRTLIFVEDASPESSGTQGLARGDAMIVWNGIKDGHGLEQYTGEDGTKRYRPTLGGVIRHERLHGWARTNPEAAKTLFEQLLSGTPEVLRPYINNYRKRWRRAMEGDAKMKELDDATYLEEGVADLVGDMSAYLDFMEHHPQGRAMVQRLATYEPGTFRAFIDALIRIIQSIPGLKSLNLQTSMEALAQRLANMQEMEQRRLRPDMAEVLVDVFDAISNLSSPASRNDQVLEEPAPKEEEAQEQQLELPLEPDLTQKQPGGAAGVIQQREEMAAGVVEDANLLANNIMDIAADAPALFAYLYGSGYIGGDTGETGQITQDQLDEIAEAYDLPAGALNLEDNYDETLEILEGLAGQEAELLGMTLEEAETAVGAMDTGLLEGGGASTAQDQGFADRVKELASEDVVASGKLFRATLDLNDPAARQLVEEWLTTHHERGMPGIPMRTSHVIAMGQGNDIVAIAMLGQPGSRTFPSDSYVELTRVATDGTTADAASSVTRQAISWATENGLTLITYSEAYRTASPYKALMPPTPTPNQQKKTERIEKKLAEGGKLTAKDQKHLDRFDPQSEANQAALRPTQITGVDTNVKGEITQAGYSSRNAQSAGKEARKNQGLDVLNYKDEGPKVLWMAGPRAQEPLVTWDQDRQEAQGKYEEYLEWADEAKVLVSWVDEAGDAREGYVVPKEAKPTAKKEAPAQPVEEAPAEEAPAEEQAPAEEVPEADEEADLWDDPSLGQIFRSVGQSEETDPPAAWEATSNVFIKILKKAKVPLDRRGTAMASKVLKEGVTKAAEAKKWTQEKLSKVLSQIARFIRELSDGVYKEVGVGDTAEVRRETVMGTVENPHQIEYTPVSQVGGEAAFVPRHLSDAMREALVDIQRRTGKSIDEFVMDELGWSMGELSAALYHYQVEAVAMAIDAIKNGRAVINGDQTGLGKGRTAATVVVWAKKQGMIPVFVTHNNGLYADFYRDMAGIGSPEFSGLVTDSSFKAPLMAREGYEEDDGDRSLSTLENRDELLESMGASGELPEGIDAVLTTYHQLNPSKGDMTRRLRQLQAIAPNAVFVFDEAHQLGIKTGEHGDLSRAEAILQAVEGNRGTYFLTATFAKEPEHIAGYHNMDYDVPEVASVTEVIDALTQHGTALQQVMTAQMAENGSFFRRERNMDDITIATQQIAGDAKAEAKFSRAMNRMLRQDRVAMQGRSVFANLAFKALNKADNIATSGANKVEPIDMWRTHPGSSLNAMLYYMANIAFFSQKVNGVVDEVTAAVANNMKPIVWVQHTGGSVIEQHVEMVAREAQEIERLAEVAQRYRDRGDEARAEAIEQDVKWKRDNLPSADEISWVDTLTYLSRKFDQIKVTPPGSVSRDGYYVDMDSIDLRGVNPSEESQKKMSKGTRALGALRKLIELSDLNEFPVSPLDEMQAKLAEAGLSVGEVTGRKYRIDIREDGTRKIAPIEKGKADKNQTINDFNAGSKDVQVLFGNEAMSTGFSLHASKTFKDQRDRVSIFAQAYDNTVTFMQALGRTNRAGSVEGARPQFKILHTDHPTEMRYVAQLVRKVQSLNANTTASGASQIDLAATPNLFNPIGDQAVLDALNANPELVILPSEKDADGRAKPLPTIAPKDFAKKVIQQLILVDPAKARAVSAELDLAYNASVDLLLDTGQNADQARMMDVQAVSVGSTEIKPPVDKTKAETDVFQDGVRLQRERMLRTAPLVTPLSLTARVAQSEREDGGTILRDDAEFHQERVDRFEQEVNDLKKIYDAHESSATEDKAQLTKAEKAAAAEKKKKSPDEKKLAQLTGAVAKAESALRQSQQLASEAKERYEARLPELETAITARDFLAELDKKIVDALAGGKEIDVLDAHLAYGLAATSQNDIKERFLRNAQDVITAERNKILGLPEDASDSEVSPLEKQFGALSSELQNELVSLDLEATFDMSGFDQRRMKGIKQALAGMAEATRNAPGFVSTESVQDLLEAYDRVMRAVEVAKTRAIERQMPELVDLFTSFEASQLPKAAQWWDMQFELSEQLVAVSKMRDNAERILQRMATMRIGDIVRVNANVQGRGASQRNDIVDTEMVLVDVRRAKRTDEVFALADWEVVLLGLEDHVEIRVPFTKLEAGSARLNTTVSSEGDKSGPVYRVEGNLELDQKYDERAVLGGNTFWAVISGLADSGSVVFYTNEEGQMSHGVLMPRGFSMDAVAVDEPAIVTPNEAMQLLTKEAFKGVPIATGERDRKARQQPVEIVHRATVRRKQGQLEYGVRIAAPTWSKLFVRGKGLGRTLLNGALEPVGLKAELQTGQKGRGAQAVQIDLSPQQWAEVGEDVMEALQSVTGVPLRVDVAQIKSTTQKGQQRKQQVRTVVNNVLGLGPSGVNPGDVDALGMRRSIHYSVSGAETTGGMFMAEDRLKNPVAKTTFNFKLLDGWLADRHVAETHATIEVLRQRKLVREFVQRAFDMPESLALFGQKGLLKNLDMTTFTGYVRRLWDAGGGKVEEAARKLELAMFLHIDLLNAQERGYGTPEQQWDRYGALAPAEIREAYELSQNLPAEIQVLTNEIIATNAKIGELGTVAAVLGNYYDQYTTRIWRKRNVEGKDEGRSITGSWMLSTPLAKPRKLESALHGYSEGFELQVQSPIDAQQIARQHVAQVIFDRKLMQSLVDMEIAKQPKPGQPIPADYVTVDHPNFKKWRRISTKGRAKVSVDHRGKELWDRDLFVADDGTVMQRDDVYVQKAYADRLNAVLGRSKFAEHGIIKGLAKVNFTWKYMMLALSLFHHQAYVRSFSLAGHSLRPGRGYRLGLDAANNFGDEVQDLIAAGFTYTRTYAFDQERLQNLTYADSLLDKLPVVGPVKNWLRNLRDAQTDFLFQRLGPQLKLQGALLEYRGLLKHNAKAIEAGEMTRHDCARIAANMANDDFGGLNLQRMAIEPGEDLGSRVTRSVADPTTWHSLRMLFLAPDWTISNLRTVTGLLRRGKEREAYARMWGRIITKGLGATFIFNYLMAALDDDDKDPERRTTFLRFQDNYKRAWDEGHLRWLAVDITPIYRTFKGATGGEYESYSRRYFSLIGHFDAPAKWTVQGTRTVKYKLSPVATFATDLVGGSDWAGRRYTSMSEILGVDDKGVYRTSRKGKYRKGDPKGGKFAGQTVARKFGTGPVQFDELPSFAINKFVNTLPIPAQEAVSFIMGETDAFDALAHGAGFHTSASRLDPVELQMLRREQEDFERALSKQ